MSNTDRRAPVHRTRLHGLISVSRLSTADTSQERPKSAEYGVLRVDNQGPGSYHLSPMVLRRHALAQQQLEHQRVRKTLQQLKVHSQSMSNLLGKPTDMTQRHMLLTRQSRPRSRSVDRHSRSPRTTSRLNDDANGVPGLMYPSALHPRRGSLLGPSTTTARRSYPPPHTPDTFMLAAQGHRGSSDGAMPPIAGDRGQRYTRYSPSVGDPDAPSHRSSTQAVSLPSLFRNATTETLQSTAGGDGAGTSGDRAQPSDVHARGGGTRHRSSIDQFLMDPMSGSHHMQDAEFRHAMRLTPFNIKELLLRKMNIPPNIAAMDDDEAENADFMNFVVSLAIHGRRLMMTRDDRKHNLGPHERKHSPKARPDRQTCKFCVAIRVGGGYVFVGFADEEGRCIGCGRFLDFDLSDPTQASMVNWAVQFARHRRRMKGKGGRKGQGGGANGGDGVDDDDDGGGRRKGRRGGIGGDGGDGDDEQARLAKERQLAWASRQATRAGNRDGDGFDGRGDHGYNSGAYGSGGRGAHGDIGGGDGDGDGDGDGGRNGRADGLYGGGGDGSLGSGSDGRGGVGGDGFGGGGGGGLWGDGHGGGGIGDSLGRGGGGVNGFGGAGTNGDGSGTDNISGGGFGDDDDDGNGMGGGGRRGSRAARRSVTFENDAFAGINGDGSGGGDGGPGNDGTGGRGGSGGDGSGDGHSGDDGSGDEEGDELVDLSTGRHVAAKTSSSTAAKKPRGSLSKARRKSTRRKLRVGDGDDDDDDDGAGERSRRASMALSEALSEAQKSARKKRHKMPPQVHADPSGAAQTLQSMIKGGDDELLDEEAAASDAIKYAYNYCILDPEHVKYYLKVFKDVDANGDHRLDYKELGRGLRQVNNHLITNREVDYVLRVLDVVNESMGRQHRENKRRISFRLFSVIAALSERVTKLDSVVRNKINTMDYRALEEKLKHAKHLFYVNDLRKTGTISMEALEIEMQAGNLKSSHRREVMQQIAQEGIEELTFLDYLAYIPLFLDIHDAILDNPLDDSRNRDFAQYRSGKPGPVGL
ncbi:hypothetical protein PTSG_12711 [Salpingoeca rosetta]|uniref:EF-hand domain-containing protein n=1 Tax=Salpingoeca rosetta (strain ATCC 50818 / BSB-021) TaxID=946362 RepID=F2UJF2_SALR5|nr:uncharacterized protein PTSG_12711 [Salpingoeca rosetta]EGD77251.1 hypothetical protein PTSG_12711 [Salpingoeca rosetta]|eukprot:XP_004990595.1 hypothetical protein PTSG_12711 [Salpingoeca rosetta]